MISMPTCSLYQTHKAYKVLTFSEYRVLISVKSKAYNLGASFEPSLVESRIIRTQQIIHITIHIKIMAFLKAYHIYI